MRPCHPRRPERPLRGPPRWQEVAARWLRRRPLPRWTGRIAGLRDARGIQSHLLPFAGCCGWLLRARDSGDRLPSEPSRSWLAAHILRDWHHNAQIAFIKTRIFGGRTHVPPVFSVMNRNLASEKGFHVFNALRYAVGRERVEEDASVSLALDARIEQHQHPAIFERADQPPEALLQRDHRAGHLVVE